MGLDYSVEIKAKLQGFDKLDEWDAKIKAMSQGVDIPLNLGGSGKNSVKTQAANIGKTITTGVAQQLKSGSINKTIEKYANDIKKQFDDDASLSNALKQKFGISDSEANKMVSKLRSEANKIDSEAQREINRIQQQASRIATDYENKVLDNKMSNAANYLKQFSKDARGYGDLEDSVYSAASSKQKLNTALADLSSNPSIDNQRKVVDLYNDFDNSLKSANNSAKMLTRQNEKMVSGKNLSALENKMRSFGENNTRMGKYNQSKLNEMINSIGSIQTVGQEKELRAQFESFKSNISNQGLTGKSIFGEIGRGFKQITQFAGTYGAIQKITDGFVSSISELKDLDSILTEISKTSDLTSSELKQLGNDSFEHASKYGMNAADYLYGVQEMSRSGFYGDKATELADLSVLTQAAGDVDSDIANSYLLATNAAYNYRGSVEKLNAVLDGQNMITNRNSVSMSDMADATSKVASVAAQAGIKEDQLSAMIGTVEARTKLGGNEVGNSLKGIIVNLQNVNSDKIRGTLDDAGASMTEYVNGVEQLRNPIDILRDLAKTYNSLGETDPLKSEITTNIGQKYHANKLAALLTGWEDYEKMLKDYSEGAGSAEIEAQKSANNIQGNLNKLSNQFTDTVGNIVNSDLMNNGVKGLTTALSGLNTVTDKLGTSGSIASVIGLLSTFNNSGLFAKDSDNAFTIMGTSLSDLGKNFKEAGKASKESGLFGLGGGLDVLFNGTDRQLKDVDSLIPKIDLDKAKKYIKDLDNAELSGANGLKKHLDTLKEGEKYVSDYATATLGQKRNAEDLVKANEAARQSIIDQNKAIQESTFGAKISNSFASIGKSALALAGNIGVSLLVAGAINEIGEAWINYSQKQEKAIETGDKALTTYQKNLEEFSNASSVVDEVGERFIKLQEGVRNGQNISLTNDEFEEYKNLASELSSVIPDLVSGYDSLGNPIINSVKSMGDLNNVLKEQKQLLNQQNINNAKDYVDAFNAQSSQLKTGNQQEQGFAQRQKLLDAMVSQINSDKAKGINTNFSDYMTQSDAFTGFQAFSNDVSNSIKEFASDHPIIGGFLDNIWNAEPTMVQARNNRKLGSNFAKSFQDNSAMLDDIKSSMDVSKMSAEDMSNEMLDYNLGMKKILEDAGVNLDDINQIYKDAQKLSGKEREQKLDDYNTALENANKQIAQLQKQNESEWNAAFDNTKPLIESMLQGEDNGMNYNLLQDTTKSALSQIVNGMDVKAARSIGLISEDGSMDTKSIKSWADGIAQNIKSSGAEEALNDLFTLQENKNDLGFKEYSSQVDSLVNDISSKVPELSGDLLKSTSGISDSLSDLKHQRVALMNDGFSERLLNDLSNADLEILWKLNSDGMIDGIENAKQAIEDYKKALEDNDPNKYFNAWTEATSSANEGAKYNSMLSGYEAAKKAYESGEVGTDDFKTFAAMISPTGSDDARNFAENYPKFERYFQEGKAGVENFLNDLSTLQTTTGEKMASLGDDGNWDFNVTDINDVAQKLGVGSEMVGALFGRLRDFGYDNSIITSAEEGGKRIGELITNLEKEKDRNEKLTSITGENEQGYNTTAGDHTFGNQTSIDESNAKIKQYNEGIVETISNTKDLIKAQNDSEKSRQKAAISAAKALKEQKDLAEQSGLYDTADLIQGQIEQLGKDFGIKDITAEVNFDVSQATENAQDLIDKIETMKDHGADTSSQMKTLADTIKKIGEHDGDISTLTSEFNGLAQATGSVFRMDENGTQFNVTDKIAEIQQLADKATLLSTKGSDASDTLASMVDGIQSLSASNVDVSNLVGLYNSLAKSTGLDNRMELTGEIVSVDEYSGEMPTVPAKVTINADVSGAEGVENLTQSLSSIPKGTTTTVNVDVSGEEDVSNLTSSMESVPDNTPVTISCTVENQEQLDQITQKASELNAQGKQITVDAKIGNVDTASLLDGGNKTIEVKGKITDIDTSAVENKEVTLKGKIEFENPEDLESGGTKGNSLIDTSSVIRKKVEFTADTSGVDPLIGELTAEDIQKTVTVNEEKGTEVTNEQPEPVTQEVDREVNDSETSKEPAPVTQEVNQKLNKTIELGTGETQQGGVITYQSKVEPPEVPDVKGGTVVYKSKVQKPAVPDVEGKTVIYKSKVEEPSVHDINGGTIKYTVEQAEAPSGLTGSGTIVYTNEVPPEPSGLTGSGTVVYVNDVPAPPTGLIGSGTIIYSNSVPAAPTGLRGSGVIVYTNSVPAAPGGGKVNGTAHSLGTAFANGTIPKLSSRALAMGSLEEDATHRHEMKALASGDWRTKKSETALVGELGQELVVCGNRWYTVGDNGAEFARIPAGSIVFNHLQTEEIFRNGYVTSGGGRGKIVGSSARLSGSAHAQGTAYASGTESKWKNAVDWIERLLTKLELTAELAGLKSENRTSVKNKNSYIDKQYKTTSSLITANQKAVKAYQKAAGRVGLAGDLKKKVLTGNYNIQDYSEANQQKIKDYQEMIDKARECTKAVEELKKQQKELEQTKLDNVVNYYDSINSKLEAQQSIYSAQQKFYQESGHGGNEQERKMIDEQLKLQKLITKNLDKEASNYAKQLKSAKKKFGENSNEYREALAKYYEIKSAKVESQTSEENLKNQRREISYNLKQYIIDGFERVASRLSANEKYYTASNASANTRIGNYTKQIDNYNSQIDSKRQLQKLYIKRMAQLKEGDEEYQELSSKVAKLGTEMIDLATSIEDTKDNIRKARWEAFNNNMTSLNNRITENDEIRKMLNQNGMVNREDGTLNADGYANILLIAKGMELNNQKMADYKVALSKVKEELDHGVISQSEYNEYVNQYQSEIRKAASANKDYSDSLISMYKTQIKYENEALQDNIKKRKEALGLKEDYYQYDRKIKTQTKDINTLKAQIAALEGATNAADKARKRLLEEQLSQKQDDLNDDVRSHRVDLMTSGYDKLSQSASDTMNNTLDELETNTEAQKQCVDNMLAYLERGFSSTGESISSAMGEASESIVTGFESALGRISSLLEDTAIKVSDAFSKAINSSTSVTNPNNASADKTTTDINTDAVYGLDESNSSIVNDSTNGKNAKPIHVTSIKLSKTSITLTEGQSAKIKVTVSPSNASEKSVTCSGGNSNVSASISGSNLVLKGLKTTGKGDPVTITVKTVDSVAKKATIKVKVRTKTAENLVNKAGKGKTNTGKSLVNKTLKKYNYGAFSTQQQLQLAKDYGIKATASNIYSKDIQTQLADKLKTRFIKDEINSIIKSLPDENRTSKEISKISALGQHVSKNHKKRLTKAGSVELAKAVGLKYSSNYDKWTSKQKNELLSKLKNYGFSSGGIVKKGRYLPVDGFAEIMKKAAINNGDDGWISVKRGEEILNNDQVKEQIKLANHVMAQSKMYEMQTKMLEGIINNSSSVSENNNNVIYYDSFLRVEGNITEDVLPKVESMIKQNIEAAQSSAFKDISKQFSKEFDKLGMRRRR